MTHLVEDGPVRVTLSEISTAELDSGEVETRCRTGQSTGMHSGDRATLPRLHPALIVVAGACAVLFHQMMKADFLATCFTSWWRVSGCWPTTP